MERLEQKSRKRAKRKNLQHHILQTIGAAGVLSVALVAPNVLSALSKLGIVVNKRQKEYVGSSASKLVKRGLLHFDGRRYQLTLEGEKLLRRWEFGEFKLPKSKKWDQKWRVLIFDIPEKRKNARNQLTLLLKRAGLERLQDSVWVYPHDCEEIITLLKTDFGVGKDLLYLIVEELENDRHLRKLFGLSN